MNCGMNAEKNISALGLETLVTTPRRNRFPDVGAGAQMPAGPGPRDDRACGDVEQIEAASKLQREKS